MGFLDRFRGKAQIKSPIELRDALIDAAADRDLPRFTALCNTHTDAIRESFKDWVKVPDDMRHDTAAMQRYAEALWLLASVFENAGDGTLKAILANPEDNPATAWEEDWKHAEHLIQEGQAADAVAKLQATLASLDGLKGTLVDRYRPVILGRLGIALYHAGDARGAMDATRRALTLCQQAGDEEGVAAYTRSLATLEQRDYQVVFKDTAGREIGRNQPLAGPVEYGFIGGAAVPSRAEALHRQGRSAGERSDYPAAIRLLTEAAEVAPLWPYPIYDRAYIHLLRKDWATARRLPTNDRARPARVLYGVYRY